MMGEKRCAGSLWRDGDCGDVAVPLFPHALCFAHDVPHHAARRRLAHAARRSTVSECVSELVRQ
jgi:hypothetical protein